MEGVSSDFPDAVVLEATRAAIEADEPRGPDTAPNPDPTTGRKKGPSPQNHQNYKGSMGDVAALGKWSGDKATKPSLWPQRE